MALDFFVPYLDKRASAAEGGGKRLQSSQTFANSFQSEQGFRKNIDILLELDVIRPIYQFVCVTTARLQADGGLGKVMFSLCSMQIICRFHGNHALVSPSSPLPMPKQRQRVETEKPWHWKEAVSAEEKKVRVKRLARRRKNTAQDRAYKARRLFICFFLNRSG